MKGKRIVGRFSRTAIKLYLADRRYEKRGLTRQQCIFQAIPLVKADYSTMMKSPLAWTSAIGADARPLDAALSERWHARAGPEAPGDTYPVFKTDFGTVGIQTCYDNFFPEVGRSLALQGAEIIFLPIWGDGRGNGYQWDIVARARAIDNAVYLVASIYSDKRSLIVDPNGKILGDTGGKSGMVMADIDLDQRTFERWLSVRGYGEWKSLHPKERRPDTYQGLAKKPR